MEHPTFMRSLLVAPTWQVFILFILPVVFPDNIIGAFLGFTWLSFISYATYYLAINLFERLPKGSSLSIKRFNFYFFFAIAYVILVLVLTGGKGYLINQDNYRDYGWNLALIIPLHIFTMFCIFYAAWFIAKAISTIESRKEVHWDAYLGNFILILIFPVGIWFLHPKVRGIFR
jgi:hypothetical protein